MQADGRGDELLLRDVHLEEAVGVRLLEDLGERRVAHLAVEGDHVSAGGPERRERLAVRLARRHLLAELVPRQLERPVREAVRLAGLRLCDLDADVADAAELLDRRVGIVERLAVPAVLVLDGLDALALDRARHDHRRAAGRLCRFLVRAIDLLDVVSVDLDRVPAERARALDVHAVFQPIIVSPRWPSRFTSMIAVRLSSS